MKLQTTSLVLIKKGVILLHGSRVWIGRGKSQARSVLCFHVRCPQFCLGAVEKTTVAMRWSVGKPKLMLKGWSPAFRPVERDLLDGVLASIRGFQNLRPTSASLCCADPLQHLCSKSLRSRRPAQPDVRASIAMVSSRCCHAFAINNTCMTCARSTSLRNCHVSVRRHLRSGP